MTMKINENTSAVTGTISIAFSEYENQYALHYYYFPKLYYPSGMIPIIKLYTLVQ